MERARKKIPLGKFIPAQILKIPLGRMFVAIGYLPSSKSPSISMKLNERGDVELSTTKQGEHPSQHVASILKEFKKSFKDLGLRPLKLLTNYSLPGGGVHSGGWLPMGSQSDLQGRPIGVRNIHLVDASILPNIPAGPITFTIMANAIRIVETSIQ
jgi:choline dehydrogenase-like flavoprotein